MEENKPKRKYTKRSTTTTKEEAKNETKTTKSTKTTKNKEIGIEDISPELMSKLFVMFQQMNAKVEENNVENNAEVIDDNNKKFTEFDLSDDRIQRDSVRVESLVNNLTYTSSITGAKYRWNRIGQIKIMSIAEVRAMESDSMSFLHTPWCIAHDRRVNEAFEIEDIYNAVQNIKDIKKAVKMSDRELAKTLNAIPKFKSQFANAVATMIENKTLPDESGLISKVEKATGMSITDRSGIIYTDSNI